MLAWSQAFFRHAREDEHCTYSLFGKEKTITGNDLIASSLRLIGVLASGETPTGAEGSDALSVLNNMLDSWNAEHLAVFRETITEHTLTASTHTYTMGSGGDIDVTRPAKIERVSIVNLSNASQPLELPIEVLDEDKWQRIPVKDIESSLPSVVFDNKAFPLRSLRFWPTPSVEVKTRIYWWTPLTAFTLAADNTFPPGYEKAIRYNLAVDLAPEFGRTVPVAVAFQADKSMGIIKRMNLPKLEMSVDAALRGGGGQYNWITDGLAGRR